MCCGGPGPGNPRDRILASVQLRSGSTKSHLILVWDLDGLVIYLLSLPYLCVYQCGPKKNACLCYNWGEPERAPHRRTGGAPL